MLPPPLVSWSEKRVLPPLHMAALQHPRPLQAHQRTVAAHPPPLQAHQRMVAAPCTPACHPLETRPLPTQAWAWEVMVRMAPTLGRRRILEGRTARRTPTERESDCLLTCLHEQLLSFREPHSPGFLLSSQLALAFPFKKGGQGACIDTNFLELAARKWRMVGCKLESSIIGALCNACIWICSGERCVSQSHLRAATSDSAPPDLNQARRRLGFFDWCVFSMDSITSGAFSLH